MCRRKITVWSEAERHRVRRGAIDCDLVSMSVKKVVTGQRVAGGQQALLQYNMGIWRCLPLALLLFVRQLGQLLKGVLVPRVSTLL